MSGLVKLLGIAYVALGVIFFLKPANVKKFCDYFMKEKQLKLWSVIAIAFGVMFLMAASSCAIPWIVAIFGILAIAKGIILLTPHKKKLFDMANNLVNRSPKDLRVYAVAVLLLGVILIYAV